MLYQVQWTSAMACRQGFGRHSTGFQCCEAGYLKMLYQAEWSSAMDDGNVAFTERLVMHTAV